MVCMVTSPLTIRRLHEAASFYQRALLANALTSALRLHQRLPHFQLSRAFLAQALLEDSCHYLLYSLIFVNSYPVTSILPSKGCSESGNTSTPELLDHEPGARLGCLGLNPFPAQSLSGDLVSVTGFQPGLPCRVPVWIKLEVGCIC